MNRIQYFFSGLLSLVLLALTSLYIGTGRMVYGVDAFILAIFGWLFMQSLICLVDSIKNLIKTDTNQNELNSKQSKSDG